MNNETDLATGSRVLNVRAGDASFAAFESATAAASAGVGIRTGGALA
jgi:hypothetical protein